MTGRGVNDSGSTAEHQNWNSHAIGRPDASRWHHHRCDELGDDRADDHILQLVSKALRIR